MDLAAAVGVSVAVAAALTRGMDLIKFSDAGD